MMDDESLDQIAGYMRAKIEEAKEQAKQEIRDEFSAILEQIVSQVQDILGMHQQAIDQIGLTIAERLAPESYNRWLMETAYEMGVSVGGYADFARGRKARDEQQAKEDDGVKVDAAEDGDAGLPG
jgi:membrane peptidoglycan carboxypeptidase